MAEISNAPASVEHCGTGLLKIYHKETLRTALFDINEGSVYLFNKNRRVIATEKMNYKSLVAIMKLCKDWVCYGTYDEGDFSA